MDDCYENNRYPKLSESQKCDFEILINETLTTLSSRESKVFKMRLGLIGVAPMSPQEIGNHLNIDFNRVHKIEAKVRKVIDALSQAKKQSICELTVDRAMVYSIGFEFDLNDDESSYRVVDIGEEYSFRSENVNFPPFYNGKPVTHIGEYVIPNMSCCFKHIYFPETIREISENAFYGTRFVESLTVAKENPVYHSADNCVIRTSSKELVRGCSTSVLPTDGSVTCISRNAFANCGSLEWIVIPKEISRISSCAFYNCDNLSTVFFMGTELEWLNMKIGTYNHCLHDAKVLFYSAEAPVIEGAYWRFVNHQPLPWSDESTRKTNNSTE